MTLVLDETTPIARKAHECDLCFRTIHPGEKYYRQRNVGDDGIYAWKNCGHCSALVRIIGWRRLSWDDEGYGPESVAEYEPETVAEARLKVGWKHRWRHRNGRLWDVPEAARAVSDVPLPPEEG